MASSARLDELRKKFDENPRRYFAPLANEYRKAGETEQAIAICREYLPQQPGHMSGHIVFGQALYEARQFEEAKTVFETALSLDPENLIALRHLGDIALILGDSEGARGWYRRVLDADPRNEEIQAQLASLDKAASAAPTPAVTPAQPSAPPATPAVAAPAVAAPAPRKPTPSSAPTVVVSAIKAPTAARSPAPSAAPVTATSQTAEVRLDEILPAQPELAPPSLSSASTMEVTQTAVPHTEPRSGETPAHGTVEGLESHAAASEAPPLDSFSLDGLETTSLASAPTATPPAPASAESLPDLDLGPVASSPASLIEAPPPVAPTPAVEAAATSDELPSLDLDLGSVAPAAPSDVVREDFAPAAAPEAEAPAGPDLVFISPDEQPAAAAAETVPDLQLDMAAVSATPAAEAAPEPALPTQPVEAGPFVTETMAELYLQQGHREEALRVYRALMEQRPSDTMLAAKVRAIESGVSPGGSQDGRFADVLRMIAERRPGYHAERSAGMSPAPTAPLDVTEVPPQSAFPEGAATPKETPVAETAAPGVGRSDRLAVALGFGASDGSAEAAAMTLAAAFATNGSGALHGAPARPAASELSLDSVFGSPSRASGPPAPPPSSFSFDQFFANKDAANAAGPGTSGTSESAQEVAQFTQWLEGLKRR